MKIKNKPKFIVSVIGVIAGVIITAISAIGVKDSVVIDPKAKIKSDKTLEEIFKSVEQ